MNDKEISMDLDLLEAALSGGVRFSDATEEDNEEDFNDDEFFEDRKTRYIAKETDFDDKPIKEEIVESVKNSNELLKSVKPITKENISLFDDGEKFRNDLLELLKDKELDVNDADLMKMINVWNKTSVAQLLQVLVFDRTIRKIFSNNQKINFFVDDTLQDWNDKYKEFTIKLQDLRVEKLNECKSEVEEMYKKMETICKDIKDNLKEYKQTEIFIEEESIDIVEKLQGKIIKNIEKRHFNQKSIEYIEIVEAKTKKKITNIMTVFGVFFAVLAGLTYVNHVFSPQQQTIGIRKWMKR